MYVSWSASWSSTHGPPMLMMHQVLFYRHQSCTLILKEDASEWCIRDAVLPALCLHLPWIQNSCWARGLQQQNTCNQTATQAVCPKFQEKYSAYQEINYYRSISTQQCLLYPNYFTVCDAISGALNLSLFTKRQNCWLQKSQHIVYRF